jgi:hypothetical protein
MKKSIEIPIDLYDFLENRAARYNCSVETMTEAIIAARRVQCLGGASEEIACEFERRLNLSDEEYIEQVAHVRAMVHKKLREMNNQKAKSNE